MATAARRAASRRAPAPWRPALHHPQGRPEHGIVSSRHADLGYVEGKNIDIEYRYAEGRPDRLPELAEELVRLKPDVMFVLGGDVAPFVRKATQTIPIVYAMSADPVQLGLAASLARPGGNATGVTFLQDELAAKRLELLKEAAPRSRAWRFLQSGPRRQRATPCKARSGGPRHTAAIGGCSRYRRSRWRIQRRHEGGHRCDLRSVVAAHRGEPCAHRRPRHEEPPAAGRRLGCMGPGGWARLLRPQRRRDDPPFRPLRGQNPQGRQARRAAGPATHAFRTAGQSQDRQSPRPHHSGIVPAASRQGDRMKWREFRSPVAHASVD